MITIRPFERTNEDHRLAVGIFNAVWVGQEETVEAWQERDEKTREYIEMGALHRAEARLC